MLVLTRKIGERISVPCCDVTIEVLQIFGQPSAAGRDRAARDGGPSQRDPGTTWPVVGTRDGWGDVAWDAQSSVLLADADANLVGLYQRFLLGRGFRARVVHNALDCMSQLREKAPDVLVLDPGLPWGGGGGVLALMREPDGAASADLAP